jgi:2-amino-1-hydroxyethylphosphonate dioxygenase (glycine-forming)
MILAALFHDLGHVVGLDAGESAEGMGGCGIPRHEHVGADFLKICGFSDRICKLVRSHVSAKRYLVWKDPNYKLSDASRTTLNF